MTDNRIIRFFKKHHVLTVASVAGSQPWCASCFYVYIEDENALVFTSDPETRHSNEFKLNPEVAGTVVLETFVIGKIRGIQFTGIVEEPSGDLLDKARNAYLRRFPVASLMKTHLWIIRLNYIKMTDNRLGFGKKLIWAK
ncbi:MAG TPA: pyridoxamine 5'-phosphate oxidase family protein [Bacteroidales bacterium]|nr:pyridoxamine 5'-phosphate oxidase family protein [Bacteroidales bacterium]